MWQDRDVRIGIAIAMLLSACIRSGSTTCEDGTICRDGTVCAPAGEHMLCVTPEQLAACDGAMEYDACGADRCYPIDDGLVCLAIGCGNFFTDTEEGEQCDDGNNTSQDGCSADCSSNERCGNGVVDALRGERCDDGNHVSHDGCSSRCDDEVAAWIDTSRVPASPSYRSGRAMTFDVRRARVVMFGGSEPGSGSSTSYVNVTSEWDRRWTEPASANVPQARERAGFAYNERDGVSVLFGGREEDAMRADTWEWNGMDWRPVDAIGPSARMDAALAYDPVHDRVVLFGGQDRKNLHLGDTWQLQGGAWTQIATTGPPLAMQPSMTFDPVAGVIVLVAGGEQWVLDGATWTRIGTVSARSDARMWIVFDIALGQRLLLGRAGAALTTWAWDGVAWIELGRPTVPHDNAQGVVADRVRGGVIAVIGNEVAIWSSSGELDVVATPNHVDPSVRAGAAAANDLGRREVILFGGTSTERNVPTRIAAMAAFDGLEWRVLTPSTRPSARMEHAMTYDPARGRVVLFGGDTESGPSGETWLWDGATWMLATPTMSPPARSGHAMTYDREREVVVLFGGFDGTKPLGDTWEWDGASWTNRASVENPTARIGASIAHDPIGGGVLLFGGGDDVEIALGSDETWRLTASGWTKLEQVILPSRRMRATLTWAPARRRLLLVGGERARTQGIAIRQIAIADTWEWDGARWRSLIASPLLATQHVAFAAPDGSTVATFGGNTLDSFTLQMFEHRWLDRGSYETCVGRLDADGDGLGGCADPDCWSACTPLCPPEMANCPAAPACGDGTCSALETVWLCPQDCGTPAVSCGDLVCDGSETCLGDCP